MSITELANDFTNLLKQNDHKGAAEKYNADTIVSYEAMEGPMAVCEGREAVKQKSDWWTENHEVHSGSVEAPISMATNSPCVSRWTSRQSPQASASKWMRLASTRSRTARSSRSASTTDALPQRNDLRAAGAEAFCRYASAA